MVGMALRSAVCHAHPRFIGMLGPIRLWQLLDTYNTSPDFWERAAKLGSLVQQYTSDILNDAATSYSTTAGQIDQFKQSMNQVISSTSNLRREIESKARARGITPHTVSEMLSKELAVVVEELKAEFPPPDHAEHHEDRVKIISRALIKVEDAVVRVSQAVGVSEPKARACFGDIEVHLRYALVVTGKYKFTPFCDTCLHMLHLVIRRLGRTTSSNP